MSKGSNRTTTTSTPIIPEYLQTAQEAAFSAARDFSPEVYQGQRFVPQTPFEQQSLQGFGQFGGGAGNVQALEGAVGNILAGGIGSPNLLREQYQRDLSPEYMNQVIQDRISDATNSITSQYARGGRLGSDAFGQALGRGIGSSVAPILAQQEVANAQRQAGLAGAITDAERQAAQLQLQAGGVAPTAQDLQLQRLQALSQAGAMERAVGQLPIQAAQQQIVDENARRQAQLNALLSAGGISVPMGTTTVGTEPGVGLGQTLLGAGTLLSGIGSLGPQGAAAGFIGGALSRMNPFGN